MRIGNKIKSLRVNKGYSSEYVAEKLGISLVTYRRLERDESIPDLNALEKIASIYEISIADLLIDNTVIFNKDQSGGVSNNGLIINQLSDKLIQQFELRIEEKQNQIEELKLEINRLKKNY